jgi:hypothetical protein
VAFATDPHLVADQAGMVARAWSPADAPSSWRLTAAQFEALRDDRELLSIAATIPPEKLPPLLFTAAATFLILEVRPEPLASWFPQAGEPQPSLGAGFRSGYREFCLDHRDRLQELCSRHRYQMNEVGRCADVIPALTPAAADGRDLVLIDVGTGAGLGLHLDRYRYLYRGPGGRRHSVGDPGSSLSIEVEVRGEQAPGLPSELPVIADRVGVDTEPLDLSEPGVRAWLAACVPQEIAAVTRFQRAAEIAASHPARTIRGDACDVLPSILADCDPRALLCIVDSYVDVFFSPDRLMRFRALVDAAGAGQDLDWISVDPLVPLGQNAAHSVPGLPVPAGLLERNRREGVFGVVGRVSYRGGRRAGALLGLAHPGAAWLEWIAAQPTGRPCQCA